MVMSHSDLRELSNRWFDAYQDRRLDEVEDLMTPDCVIKLIPYDRTYSFAEWFPNVKKPRAVRSLRYNDRTINTFDGGFVIQYTLNLTEFSGRKSHQRVCIVCDCHNGKVVKLVEYIDPSKWPFVPRAMQEIESAKAAKGAVQQGH